MLPEFIQENIIKFEAIKKRQFSKLTQYISAKILEHIKSPKFNHRIKPYFRKINKEGIPFTDFDFDPGIISQIKKLINALYHARLALLDIENLDLKNYTDYWANAKLLWKNTSYHTYQACYLLTHLDVDVKEMFQDELQLILPLVNQLQEFAHNHDEDAAKIAQSLKTYPISYKIGEITGIAVDQMQPNSNDLDFKFLTQFSATLPSYIEQLSQYVRRFSSDMIENEPLLNKEQLDTLQTAALRLLYDLDNLKGNNLFISLKFLNYIHIINNVITLFKSSLEQMGHLSDSTQDVIRNNLAQLKYDVLPTLFGLVDKIEDNFMLKPGILSQPLMEKIKPLYELLIHYAGKPVDFKEKGEELLSIEDSRFLELRLERAYKRIDASKKELFRINKAQDALNNFYQIIDNLSDKNVAIHKLPVAIKNELLTQYKIMKPYVIQVDFDLHDKLIDSLQKPESWAAYFNKQWRAFNKQLPVDHLNAVIALQDKLQTLITKKRATQQFHIDLNTDLITSVHEKANLVLFPYSGTTNIFSINEADALKPVTLIQMPTGYNLTLNDQLKTRTIYLKALTSGLKYKVINLEGKYVSKTIPWERLDGFPRETMALINSEATVLPKLQELLAKAGHTLSTGYTLAVIDKIKRQPRTVYLKTTDDGLKCRTLTAESKIKKIIIPWEKIPEIPNDAAQLIKDQNKYIPQLMEHVAKAGHILLTAPDKRPFKELQGIAHCRNAVILFNNELYYVDVTNKKITQINNSDENKVHFEQLRSKIIKPYQHATEDELKLINLLTKIPQLQYKRIKKNNVIANPEQLTADQALDLYQWYNNKRNQFLIVKKAYDEFIKLLKEQKPKSVAQEEPTHQLAHLGQLDKRTKTRCRSLYNQFQPYFINGVPEELKTSALTFDKYITHALSEKPIAYKKPRYDLLAQTNEHLQKYFTEIDLEWSQRSKFYLQCAEKQFAAENISEPLKHDANVNKRAHYLIPHTNYSNYIKEFRTELIKITSVFNTTMQKQLHHQSSSIPFPELKNKNKLLAEGKQVLAIKRLFNCLYHLEELAHKLEQLNEHSYEKIYTFTIYQAYGHLEDMLQLIQDLAKDPHFGLIAKDLSERVQALWAAIQEHSDPYQTSPDEVGLDKSVQYNALWYTLNAFFVIPKHIRSLRNTNYLTPEELDELHIRAKKATTTIETLIKNSDSYVKLFLQTPNMYSLYQELKGKLNEFTTTAHDAIAHNLDQFQTKIFTPMLVEADRWEDKLGLKPGTISSPLKQILDEYYKGLLYSFDLHAKEHIQLICDTSSIKKRVALTEEKNNEVGAQIQTLKKNYKHIKIIYKHINTYLSPGLINDPVTLLKKEGKISGGLLSPADTPPITQEELIAAYRKALPGLLALTKRGKIKPNDVLIDHNFDDLFNSALKEYEPKITNLRSIIAASYHHYLGLKTTCTIRQETAKEKLGHLNELTETQEQANVIYTKEYTTESFDKQMKAFCNRHIGLQYTDKEYRNKLGEYLLTFKEAIVNQAKTTEDINLTVKNLLKEKIKLFEQNNFVKYYHMDTVRVALAQFKNYFSLSNLAIERQNSLVENETTLGAKTKKINHLITIAENDKLSIEERFSQIKRKIEAPRFSGIILSHKQVDPFSFSYLLLCIMSLLEILDFYTPTRKKLYNNLSDAVNTKPQIQELTRRLGLFATTPSSPISAIPAPNAPPPPTPT